MTTHVTPTSTGVGLSDSKEAPTAECKKQKGVPHTFTTKWADTNSLHEPLLQEL